MVQMMLQFLANGLCRGATYALVALGFGIIYSTTRVFHIAHGAVYVATAYALYLFVVILTCPPVLALPLALLVAVLLGLSIEFFVYYPIERRGASSAVLLVSSLGAYTVIINVIALLAGNQARAVTQVMESTISIGSVILARIQILQFLIAAGAVVLYWAFLVLSPLGRECRAVADNSTLAEVLGVRIERTRLAVFGVGSLLAGIGALLVALDVGMDPYVGFPVVMVSAVACIVGGLDRLLAPALGGVLLGVTQSLVVWRTSASWESTATFAVMIGFLLLRPEGLFGIRKRIEER